MRILRQQPPYDQFCAAAAARRCQQSLDGRILDFRRLKSTHDALGSRVRTLLLKNKFMAFASRAAGIFLCSSLRRNQPVLSEVTKRTRVIPPCARLQRCGRCRFACDQAHYNIWSS